MTMAIGIFLTLMTYGGFMIHPIFGIWMIIMDLIIICIATIEIQEHVLPDIMKWYNKRKYMNLERLLIANGYTSKYTIDYAWGMHNTEIFKDGVTIANYSYGRLDLVSGEKIMIKNVEDILNYL